MYDFTISGNNKAQAKAALLAHAQVGEHKNHRFSEAVSLLIDALPDGERDVQVTVNGDLTDGEDRNRTVTITLTAKTLSVPKDKLATNDEGEKTDVNTRVIRRRT